MPLPKLIDIETFFADPEFSGASISPDGTKLAYLAPKYGRTQVWVRGIDEDHEDAVCVTHNKRRGIKTYYWTDDPRWLLYRQDTDGNEDWHIYRVDLDNPEADPVDLTPMAPGSRVFGCGQSQKRPGHVVIAMNPDPMMFGTYYLEVATGETTLLHEQSALDLSRPLGVEDEQNYWSTQTPDGSYEFYAVDEETGDKRLLHRARGPENPVGVPWVLPTPDGTALILAIYEDDSEFLKLVRFDHATGEKTVIAADPDRSVCNLGIFTEDFGMPPSLFFSAATHELIAVRMVGDRPEVVPVDPAYAPVFEALAELSDGELGFVSSDDSERYWVASFIHDREPDLTYLYDRDTGESRLLFRPYPHLDPDQLAPMLPISFEARDGLPIHGFLTLPVGVEPKNLPLVLNPHGGPWAHDTWGYDREAQLLANRGYAVLKVNFRGSTGYGRTHLVKAIGELAGTMHDDLIDACEWAIEQGYADRDRLGIYGGSYGGYSTLVGVTFTPDYFAAAVDYVGVSSLPNFIGELQEFVKPHLQNSWLLYAGDPDDPEQLADMMARSPVTKTDEIVTPLLVVQGAVDARVPKAESDAIVESLRSRGVPVEYFVAEDEGHHFQNPENLITMFSLIERHFAEHLGGRSAAKD